MSISQKYAAAHADPQGAGDARPTALQIVQDEGMVGKLQDKVILVTGASSGIGIETSKALHATGATIFLPVRNLEKAKPIREEILRTSPGKGEIILLHLDLGDLDSVRACAKEVLDRTKQLDILVNNGAIMALPERVLSKQGFELQFATNHLGHFLLFQLLAERLLRSSTPDFPSKVVNVSSSGHRFGPVNFEDLTLEKNYDPWTAYAQSKLANIWMANYVERNYGPKGLHALSLMPGGIQTGLQAHTPNLQNMAAVPGWAKFLKSTEQGAATTVWAAIGTEWRDKGGVYLEDCRVGEPWVPESGMLGSGYAETAYQLESEERLWKISCELVDVPGNAL